MKSLVLFFVLLFPIYSIDDLEFPHLVSSFSISIENHDGNVRQNLALALQKLNRYKIEPESTFSFNKIVGEGSVENGFKFASVYFADEVANESGGGLCIVASAVFNTFLKAGFQTKERRKHSRMVSYVAPGLDATISYGKSDLRMKNPYKKPFLLLGEMTPYRILFKLYSTSELEYEYESRLETVEETRLQEESGKYKNGLLVYLYRDKYKNKELVESEFIHSDYIRPMYVLYPLSQFIFYYS